MTLHNRPPLHHHSRQVVRSSKRKTRRRYPFGPYSVSLQFPRRVNYGNGTGHRRDPQIPNASALHPLQASACRAQFSHIEHLRLVRGKDTYGVGPDTSSGIQIRPLCGSRSRIPSVILTCFLLNRIHLRLTSRKTNTRSRQFVKRCTPQQRFLFPGLPLISIRFVQLCLIFIVLCRWSRLLGEDVLDSCVHELFCVRMLGWR
jgi:hypothetical protein